MIRHALVVGAQRCGTTLLYELLDAHPDILMARPRRPEPKVFLSEELTAKGIDWYRDTYFRDRTTEAVLAEKSTSYLEDAAAPARAARMLGRCHVIVQLRDPVRRAVSNWRFSAANGVEERPLGQALEESLAGPRAWDPEQTSVSPFAYLERGRYLDDLEPWFAQFGDRVLVRFLEDEPLSSEQIRDLYTSLGVDPSFRPDLPSERVNVSEGAEPSLDPVLEARLRDYFAASDLGLAQRLGRELPWNAR